MSIDNKRFGMLLSVAALVSAFFLFASPQTTYHRLRTEECSTFDCWAEYYKKMTVEQGVGVALGDLQRRREDNSGVPQRCHWLAHAIGAQAAHAADVENAFARGDHTCEGGFYHGFMETLSSEAGLTVPTLAEKLCSRPQQTRSDILVEYNCLHGIGHGLMLLHDNNLTLALQSCDTLANDAARSACWSGVFMQNIITDDGDNHQTTFLSPDNLLYPCTEVDTQYKYDCYLMQAPYILRETELVAKAALGTCAQAELEFQPICAQGIGRDIAARAQPDQSAIVTACVTAPSEVLTAGCIVGALRDIIATTESKSTAETFCRAVPISFQLACTAAIRHSPTLGRLSEETNQTR